MTKIIDIKEFREKGYLQEVNRLFFHPIGLALAISFNDEGIWTLDAILDSRDDAEGFVYGDDFLPLASHAKNIQDQMDEKRIARESTLGYFIQPATKEE